MKAFRIRIERNFYGPKTEVSYDCGGGYDVVTYPTISAAQERIAELEAGEYVCAHNEAERPTYRPVRVR